jgi:hypothetical protein
VQVSDGAGGTATDTFLFTVNPVNDLPTINLIPSFTTNTPGANTTYSIPFNGISTGSSNEIQTIAVTASSGNAAIVSLVTVLYTSPATNGTISISVPKSVIGTSLITVNVNDGGTSNNLATTSFLVSVKASNKVLPTLTAISNQTIAEDTVLGPLNFAVRDADTAVTSLTVGVSSSNPGLLPTNNIILSGTGTNRTVTLTPLPNQSGTATVLMTVYDLDPASSNMSFTVTVNPVNDAPTITAPANQTVSEDTVIGPLQVGVADIDTSPAHSKRRPGARWQRDESLPDHHARHQPVRRRQHHAERQRRREQCDHVLHCDRERLQRSTDDF